MSQALQQEVESLKKEVADMRADIKDLVDAWNTARGVTAFVKWVGSIAAGAAILYNVLTHGVPK